MVTCDYYDLIFDFGSDRVSGNLSYLGYVLEGAGVGYTILELFAQGLEALFCD